MSAILAFEASHDQVIIALIVSLSGIAVAMINNRRHQDAGLQKNSDKLDAVHDLVNSEMIVRMQNELDAIIVSLAMMKEVLALKRTAGQEPSSEALDLIRTTTDRVVKLREQIDKRLEISPPEHGLFPKHRNGQLGPQPG